MKKMIVLLVAMVFLVSTGWPCSEAQASTKGATGSCSLSCTGKSVKFRGTSSSAVSEDVIMVKISLQELRDGAWYGIANTSKTENKSSNAYASKSYTVSGGHYYRVVAIHYSKTGSTVTTSSSQTNSTWISK